jgi:hypothetical protein
MPILGLDFGRGNHAGSSQHRGEDAFGRDEYSPSSTSIDGLTSADLSRRSCANPECSNGWVKPWRSRRRPIFEGQWGCSSRCVLAIVRSAVRREAGDRKAGAASSATHRHRVPLGLVMLAQGWITHPQLQAALQSQRASGNGRIGDWLVAECGLEAEQVTRGLSVQWSCPVLSVEGFSARDMALVMPKRFVEEFGLVPLRVAGSRMLYLGCEDRLNASVAYAVEQMSELRVESGLVEATDLQGARSQLMAARGVPEWVEPLADADALAARITALLESRQPLATRLVRMHKYFWMRLWLGSGATGGAGTLPASAEDMEDYIFTVGAQA